MTERYEVTDKGRAACTYPACDCDNGALCLAHPPQADGEGAESGEEMGAFARMPIKDVAKTILDMFPTTQPDPVNHPSHYTAGAVECIDAIESALGAAFPDYCRGQALKYLWRAGLKADALEDARKAEWYVRRLIATLATP